ncbi:hypothetical protein [Aneurinibacillus migulanus]|nr:hypothetical protein [Aneurinibacillus migulanus]
MVGGKKKRKGGGRERSEQTRPPFFAGAQGVFFAPRKVDCDCRFSGW